MTKHAKSLLIALVGVAAISLSSCKKKNKSDGIEFWSSFGSAYSNALDSIVAKAQEQTGVKITHVSKGSYDKTLEQMIPALNVNAAPNMTMGYPDHFAMYLADDALMPLEDYFTQEELADYIVDYMPENKFTSYGETKTYGVPFNKSTEVLGYNGTFVDYCAFRDPTNLSSIPETWAEWEEKGPLYMAIYDELIDGGKVLCGRQAVDGRTSEWVLADPSELQENSDGDLVFKTGHEGLIGLIDFSAIKDKKANTRLMSWDATDNAFITLCRQWGADYTKLDLEKNNQKQNSVIDQKGDVLFGSTANRAKVKDFLQFFADLAKDRIFGVPKELNGTYSSDAFQNGSVMFMVCSSGGLSYNTGTWHNNFRIAPIPYKDASRKYVISQGANIAITDKGDYEDCAKVLKALTTGDIQVEWCMKTGYYPCSYSAANKKTYTDFLNEGNDDGIGGINDYVANHPGTTYEERKADVFSNPARVAYREGSRINQEFYMKRTGPNGTLAATDWRKFVDDAFYGSSGVRKAVKNILERVFTDYNAGRITLDQAINDALNSADINKQAVNVVTQ